MVPPCFTQASRRGPYGVQPYSCALTGAPVAACTETLPQSAAPLRDHLPPDLPYPFPPYRVLCTVSSGLLFPSSRLRGVFNSAWVVPSLQPKGPHCQPYSLHKKRGRKTRKFSALSNFIPSCRRRGSLCPGPPSGRPPAWPGRGLPWRAACPSPPRHGCRRTG